ncbi:class I SAM-dependent rRNA methyltransferase [Pirellulaceae bacterium SH467]|jgi:23S rRNA (cytosine1962-C5)-methyltransferase
MTISLPGLRQIYLQQTKKRSFDGHHPWILEHSILPAGSEPRVGETVDLVREDGRFIGRGLYNPNSRIRIRLYTWDIAESIDESFFRKRIDRAIEHRARFPVTAESSMRLVFSEADQLSGLVVDKFGDHLVMQVTSAALLPFIDSISHRLYELYRPASIQMQVDPRSAKSEGIEPCQRFLMGSSPEKPIEIMENGLKWLVDLQGGQKTGYYLDQRENRMAAIRWIREGSKVLDVCTYVGGFALTMAKYASTAEIIALDSSERALAMAAQHAAINQLDDKVQWVQGDFFDYLSKGLDAGLRFDAIVLDPPRLASSRDNLERALAAYHRLNYLAVRMLNPGGTLVTCSCSGRVSRTQFLEMLQGVSQRAKREIQVLENRGAAPDHPVSLSCPETDYLKCVVARVLG